MAPTHKRVGIRDVAHAAGLSITTVSWVLNDKGQVAEATRRRVREVAEELGYRPNEAARALKTGRSRILGIAVAHRESGPWQQTYLPYYRSIVAGAAIEAVEHGHAVAAVPVSRDGGIEAAVPFDGLIVVDPVENDPILAECRRRGLPVVADGRPIDTGYDDVPVVESDIQGGIALVLDHAVSLGASRFALLSGAQPDAYTLDTERYFRRWCRRGQRSGVVRRTRRGETAAIAAGRLLDRHAGGIDAVHALNETYGNALLAAAAERGLAVPGDLVVTMMGEPMAASGAAYLQLDPVSIGAACVRLLVDKLEGRPVSSVVLPCSLVPSPRRPS